MKCPFCNEELKETSIYLDGNSCFSHRHIGALEGGKNRCVLDGETLHYRAWQEISKIKQALEEITQHEQRLCIDDPWEIIKDIVETVKKALRNNKEDDVECQHTEEGDKMIEKLEPLQGLDHSWLNKINELIDVVNTMQKEREAERFEIQEWIGVLETVRKSVNKLETMAKNTNTVLTSLVEENNIHEKQIDKLQMKLEPEKCETPSDKFAEQKRWIGKLCKFWDNDDEGYLYEILLGIDDSVRYPYITKEGYTYNCCEPVSKDLIYKGE